MIKNPHFIAAAKQYWLCYGKK